MEKNKFTKDFEKLLTDQLSKLYIPGLSKRKKYKMILQHLITVADSHEMLIRQVQIQEFADNEFIIKVNHDIEVHYVIGREVVNG